MGDVFYLGGRATARAAARTVCAAEAFCLLVIIGSLASCHTQRCADPATISSAAANWTRAERVPMACDARACYNADAPGGLRMYSTISETAMAGNRHGGKALLAAGLTLAPLLVGAVSFTFLRRVVPRLLAAHGMASRSIALFPGSGGGGGCCARSAARMAELAISLGSAACALCALTGLIAVDDSFWGHAALAAGFFASVVSFARVYTSLILAVWRARLGVGGGGGGRAGGNGGGAVAAALAAAAAATAAATTSAEVEEGGDREGTTERRARALARVREPLWWWMFGWLLPAQVVLRGAGAVLELEPSEAWALTVSGVTQWLTVSGVLLFGCTVAFDVAHLTPPPLVAAVSRGAGAQRQGLATPAVCTTAPATTVVVVAALAQTAI
jgi:hypothetical protein